MEMTKHVVFKLLNDNSLLFAGALISKQALNELTMLLNAGEIELDNGDELLVEEIEYDSLDSFDKGRVMHVNDLYNDSGERNVFHGNDGQEYYN